MGHVDHAHDAERDRQADCDEHEHRSEAQAEEQHFDTFIETSGSIDALDGGCGRRADLFVAFNEGAVSAFSPASRQAGYGLRA